MRQKHETATSFNEFKAITQAIQALKKGALKNAINQANANEKLEKTQELEQATGSKPKSSAQAQKGRLNPTKKAFSERQITAFRDNSQASELKRLQTNQDNNSNLRAKPSNKAFKQGLATHQEKGGKNEA